MDKRIAVVGYSLRLPGCDTDTLWQALLEKRDLVTEVEDSRWSKDAWLHPDKKHSGSSYTFAAGSLGDVSGFDAAFFGLSPREVSHMDPQQRLLLEMSWEAMERAGIAPSRLRGSNTGVFMGIASVDYAYRFADDFSAIDANTGTGTASSIASNRISYLFDLHGPSVSMDTACSSSMVAFHQACRSILSGETDQALTGGISLHLHPYGFMIFSKATMLSPDGRCRVFDADGNGYVRSEGGGVFLLKDYDKALADGDPILALVAASAVNTDGYKSGLTVPNPDAQMALMRQACEQAGIEPEQIDYLEAHGTGTAVGDPIETRAIGEALGQARSRPLRIGSIKSNLGHLETASGVAGLAKALLTIEHRQVPATISMRTPNPNIRFDEWNIEVVTETTPLPQEGVLRVGVNSFGFGGANAHVILQSPPDRPSDTRVEADEEESRREALPLYLSARSDEALREMAARVAGQLQHQTTGLYDLCWSARYRREQHEHGLLLWCESSEQLVERLNAFAHQQEVAGLFTGRRVEQASGAVWVYSGNGCQWAGMGMKLLAESEQVRRSVAEVSALLSEYSQEIDLEVLLSQAQEPGCYDLTEVAQPALFALQVGITRYLRDRGVVPAAVAGHSVGEVAAAWASGALTLEQAVKVIYYRSHYQGQTAGSGQMTAVAAAADEVQALLDELGCDRVALAGINSPTGITLAGDCAQLDRVEARLREAGTRFKRLGLDYAFHSPCMAPIEEGLKQALAGLAPGISEIPFISTVTGDELSGEALDAEYWWQNIRQPVRFEAAIDHCLARGYRTFVEIGAHPVLRGYMSESLRAADIRGVVVATLLRDQDHPVELERGLAELLLSGATVDESCWFPLQGKVVALPSYPWQRQSFWKPVSSESLGMLERHYLHPLLGYAIRQEPGCWEAELDTGRQSWLADHVVGDGVVFPGAGYVELALAAALKQSIRQGDDLDVLDVEDLEIQAPLLLDDAQTKVVRTRIEAQTGAIRIQARPHAHEGEWQEHVRARWFSGSAGRLLQRRSAALPERTPDFTREQHLAAATEIGLEYGPAFQAISHGWVEGDRVTGLCQPTEAIRQTAEGLLLHPGILDSAFQLFIPLLAHSGRQTAGVGFVPVQIGRLQLNRRRQGEMPHQIRVRLLRQSPHSLLAEVELFAGDGAALAVLTDVRFRAIPLRKQKAHAVSSLEMELHPLPLPATPSALDTASLWAAVAPVLESQADNLLAAELDPLLDMLMLAFIHEALSTEALGVAQLSESALPWVRQAMAAELLSEQATGILTASEPPDVEARQLWEMLLREYPSAFVPVHAVGRLGLHLADWLHQRGDMPVLDQERLAGVYRSLWEPCLLRGLQERLEAQVEAQLQELPKGQRLHIAECSAGEMILSPGLVTAIAGAKAQVSFLSASSAAVGEAATQLQGNTRFQALHWDQKALPVELSGLDLVLVHLDFQRPSQVRHLLHQLRSSMKPGASLLLLGHPGSSWLELLGATQEKLVAEEGRLQPGASHWQQLLKGLGYESLQLAQDEQLPAASFMLSASPASMAESDMPASPAPVYLLWSDAESLPLAEQMLPLLPGAEIAQTLSGVEERALARTADASEVRLVMLAGGWAAVDQTSAVARCADIRDLVLRLDQAGIGLCCTVLTTGIAQAQLAQQPLPASEHLVSQAAVWGFVRTLMNEASHVRLQLIDLPAEPERVDLVALVQALEAAEREDEQLLTVDGSRFVPRLDHYHWPRPDLDETVRESLTLGFDQPGQLRNLRWAAHSLPELGAQGVEVDVRATGLNFRDVMYALGLLSDEAIENGFTGPNLGLEFSGVVTATGADVTEFRPGDAVVGFGSASFSTRLVTGSETLARLPQGVGFEAAATIPTTFFTVYYALKHLARLQPGERVLIHGAAGGVGLAAIQIARLLGAEIYATVGSDSKRDVVRLLGIEAIYDSRSHTFAEDILADLPEGIDVVLNSLAGEAINQNLRVLRPFGRFLELGKRDFYENTAIGLRPFRNNISYFGIDSDQLMKVQPALTRSLFREMMDLFEQGDLSPLPYTTFAADQVVEAFRYMQQAKQIGKVVVHYEQRPRVQEAVSRPASDRKLSLGADKTFLVTGGLSGFGLRTAQWLVEKGVRHLALLSRRGQAEGDDLALIERLRAQGVSVCTYACDIADRARLAEALALISERQPALGGVVHAATVFADALAANMTNEQIAQVLAAKAFGAHNLHELIRGESLELFVLFSSATTLFGNPGQANYVGANYALEALTSLRRAQALPATCVRWGAIDDAGYLARNSHIKNALQSRMGGDALTAAAALQQLEQMLLHDVALLGVMEFDWPALSRFLPNAGAARYGLVARLSDGADQGDGGADLLTELAQLSPEEQQIRVSTELAQSLGRILMLPADSIDPEQSVYDLGFDSLMGVELMTAIEDRFGVHLPAMAISESPTISKLSQKLLERIHDWGEGGGEPTLAQIAAQHGVSEKDVSSQ